MTLYRPPTNNFIQKTLAAELLAGVTAAATFNNVTSIQNAAGVMIVDRIDTNNNETPSKVEVIPFTGTSGSTVVTLTRGQAGTTDQDHAVGAIVEFGPDVLWAQGIIDAMVENHNEDGSHKTLTDTNGNEWIKQTATASAVNEITVANAATGNAPVISATGGDTNITLTLKGKGTGTVIRPSSIGGHIVEAATALAVGDGKAYIPIPPELNGLNLTGVYAGVVTAGTTGTTDIQIHNVTDAQDMLSTKITIDSGETTSATAATAAVINTTYDDVATNDVLRIDIDAISTTPPEGLYIRLSFSNN